MFRHQVGVDDGSEDGGDGNADDPAKQADDRRLEQELQQDAVRRKLNITQLRKLKLRIEHSEGSGGRRPDVVSLQSEEDLHAAIHFEAGKWHRWLKLLLKEQRLINPALRKQLAALHRLVQKVQNLSGG